MILLHHQLKHRASVMTDIDRCVEIRTDELYEQRHGGEGKDENLIKETALDLGGTYFNDAVLAEMFVDTAIEEVEGVDTDSYKHPCEQILIMLFQHRAQGADKFPDWFNKIANETVIRRFYSEAEEAA